MSQRPKHIDYSRQVADIGPAIQGKAGELTLAAARSEAEAVRIGGAANAAAVTFLGTEARAADLGYREAGAERDIKAILDMQEGYGKVALAKQKTMDERAYAQGIYSDPLNEADPEDLRAFQLETGRILDAQSQGILSQAATITHVAEVVKRFSAQMPGQASAFRKIGADLTGINSIDTHDVHRALTQQARGDRQQEKEADAEIALTKEYASARSYTYAAAKADVEGRRWFAQTKTLGIRADALVNDSKIKDLGTAEADQKHGQVLALNQAQFGTTMAGHFSTYTQLNRDFSDPTKAKDFGLQMAGLIAQEQQNHVARINSLTRPEPGRTALSRGEADKLIAAANTLYDTMGKSVQIIDGLNMYAATVKKSDGDASRLMNNYTIMFPTLAALGKIGVAPALFAAWDSLPRADFLKRHPQLANAYDEMEGMMRGSNGKSSVVDQFVAVSEGKKVDMGTAQASPKQAMVLASALLTQVQHLGEKPTLTETERGQLVNLLTHLGGNNGGEGMASLTYTKPTDRAAAKQLLLSPGVQKHLATMDKPLLSRTLTPWANNINSYIQQADAAVTGHVTDLNAIGKDQGWTFALVTDAFGVRKLHYNLNEHTYNKWVKDNTTNAGVNAPALPPYAEAASDPIAGNRAVADAFKQVDRALVGRNDMQEIRDKGIKPHTAAMREGTPTTQVPRNTPTSDTWAEINAATRRAGPERRATAVEMRSREGNLSDVAELEGMLRRGNLKPEQRALLERELEASKLAASRKAP